jgi:hypothetical protein
MIKEIAGFSVIGMGGGWVLPKLDIGSLETQIVNGSLPDAAINAMIASPLFFIVLAIMISWHQRRLERRSVEARILMYQRK